MTLSPKLGTWLKSLGCPFKAAFMTPGVPMVDQPLVWFVAEQARVFHEDGVDKVQIIGAFDDTCFFESDVARVHAFSAVEDADEVWDACAVHFDIPGINEVLALVAIDEGWDPDWLVERAHAWTRYRATPGAKLALERIRTRSTPALAESL